MKIVIDIDEETYQDIKNGFYDENTRKMAIAIGNGKPLPEGHGDLIDRKELIEGGINKGFCDWYDEIKYAPTIIENVSKGAMKNA